jgi:tRNA-2-methylthio-N6-dimethylallyladenosine synthase
MAQAIDVRLDSLTEAPPPRVFPLPAAPLEARLGEVCQPGGKTFYIETFGCQMNVHDSEKVAGVLLRRGYRQVQTPEAAAVVFYNTCSIREKAAQKVFSRLGAFRAGQDAGRLIGVLGCVAQQEGERIFERAPWVSLVCGSASYRKLPELLAQLEAGQRRVTGLDTDTDETFETEITRRDHPFRAYLTIIEGCNKACAYCVVPFTRGPERSRPCAAILEEVRQLADVGYTEVQLLGQTVNSYRDPSPRRMTFSELLVAVAEVPGIRRVRFTTSHPRDFHREIVQAIDAVPALCEHVHLPVQSGSTRVLGAMQRGYTREEYLEKIALIRRARRPISITTDIIVGFPGETEEDFQETLMLLEQAQYDGAFSFKYSARPNTPAMAMADPVPEEEKGRRLALLQERQRQIQTARNETLIGQTFEVLVDGESRKLDQWAGRTSGNRVLNFTSPRRELLGDYVQVRVTRAGPNSLVGEQVI